MKMKLLLTASIIGLPFLATAQNTEFGNLRVIQNDSGNTSTSITLSLEAGTSSNAAIRSGSSKADYNLTFGNTNDYDAGVLVASISENGRNNNSVGETIGTFYTTVGVDLDSTTTPNRYYLALFRSPNSEEQNQNVAFAYFPYSLWLGGVARNSTNSNAGATNTLKASSGINLGTQFTTAGGGVFGLTLTSINANHTSQNGILLVNHLKNEDNYASSFANANGSFTMHVRDNGSTGTAASPATEQDPIAFVYIPTSDVGNKFLKVMGRVNNDATTDVSGGTFTIAKGGTGQWFLSGAGISPSNGTLIVSPEGGSTNNVDNIVSYQWDAANSRYVIESRDIVSTAAVSVLEDGATSGEDMFSFAFFEAAIVPTVSITSPVNGTNVLNGSGITLEANAADANGTITQVEFLRNGVVIDTDTAAPYSFSIPSLAVGSYSFTTRARDNDGNTTTSAAVVVSVILDSNNLPSNTALLFDGLNDLVTMGAAPELGAGGPPANGMTLECWFRKIGTGVTGSSGSGGITAVPLFSKGRGEADGSNTDCNYLFGITAGGLLAADFEAYPATEVTAGQNYPITGTNTPIVDGQWYHAAATYDGATFTWNLYLDGVLVGTANAVAGALPRYDSIQHFAIGSALNSTGVASGAFAGVIDEVRVWNYARSAAEIAQTKDTAVVVAPGLVGRFGLNEGTGTFAASSAGVSSGTLTNAPLWIEGAPITQNNVPTVALTAPVSGASFTLGNTINLTANAADSDGTITKVEFFAGTSKLGEVMQSPYTFDWSGMISGAYTLTARATDNSGNTSTSALINITITNPSNVSPTVSLTSPPDGATFTTNTTSITATAADNDGAITKVEFFAGSTKLGEDLTAPYELNWSSVSGGNYILTAVATDNDGATATSAPVNVGFAVPVPATLIARRPSGQPGATWKYLDNGSDQGTAWKEVAFNDSGWISGAAPLGYGDSHIATTINSGPSGNRIITTYLRRTFNLTNASAVQSLLLNILRDDGVVVYINGTEVARQNMPTGTITYLTNAASIIDSSNETTYFASNIATLPPLNDGTNVIAVEVHNRDGNSSDLGFDLEMIASSLPGTPPNVAISSPTNGSAFTAPATVAITATAGDSDGSITKVEFFNGATKLGEDTSAPYEFTWTGVAQGNYTLTARATDNLLVTTTSAGVSISVDPPNTIPPVVAITTPAANATFLAPASIQIVVDANDPDGSIAKVEFFNDATKLGEDTEAPYEYAWSGVTSGNYTLTAKATDTLTAFTISSPVTVTVNPNQAPTITPLAPENSTSLGSSGTLNLSASVSDAESAPLTVTFYGRTKNPPPGADFTLVTIPDTQFYSENISNRIQFFNNQTNWIVASKNTLNTKFVAHMGDMTQSYNTVVAEYDRASQAMATIENPTTTLLTHGIPWGGAPGNHDIASGGSTVMWNDYFGLARWSSRTVANGGYFGGGYTDNTTDNNYQLFSASGMDFIVINLKYNSSTAGNSAVMDWADALLKAHPNRRAIVTSHWLISTGNPASWGGHGQAVYDNLKDNPNLFLMLAGHIHGEGRRADTFEGRTVNTVLQDYQSRTNGGDSWLRYFTFKPSENKIYAFTYKTDTAPAGNPLGGTFETDADSQFTLDYNMTNTAPWTALGTVNVASGSNAAVTWTGLAPNSEYEWYAAVSDGFNTPVGSTIRSFNTNGNAAPSVALTSPADGASFNLPTTVPLAATASDIDGTIAKVEFFQGTTKIGEDTEAPYAIAWSAPAGSYSVIARSIDGQGSSTDSAAVSIVVNEPLPSVTIVANDATAGEYGSDQALEFTITRSGSTAGALSVQFSPSGNSSATDYSGYSGNMESIIIPSGQTSFTLPITVTADSLSEGAETLTLTLNPAPNYQIGSPSTASANIADRPDQAAYHAQITDPAKRGPADDGDSDGVANSIERFMGTFVGDPSSKGQLQVLEPSPGSFKIRYPRAKNRPELSGSLRWSSDLKDWHGSGDTDGTLTITFSESVISAPDADPEIIEASATVTGGTASKAFVRLRVE